MPLVDDKAEIRPKSDPRQEPDYLIEDILAVKAVAVGNASTDQQRRAMEYIIEKVSGYYDIAYRPDMPDGTLIAEGKRIVGAHLVGMIKTSLKKIKGKGEQPNV